MARKHVVAALSLVLCLLYPSVAFSQSRTPLEVVIPGSSMTTRIVFVVDVSGSMGSPRGSQGDHRTGLDWALASMKSITEAVGDEAHCMFYAFGGGVAVYKTEWTELPDQAEMLSVIAWYRSVASMGDMQAGTELMPALQIAMCHPEIDTSLVIITDSELDDDEEVIARIDKINAARPSGRMPIAIVCVDEDILGDTTSRKITKEVSGYYLRPTLLPCPPPAEAPKEENVR